MRKKQAPTETFQQAAQFLVETARDAYQRGWVLGTSGNFSALVSRRPLRLAITASGLDKGRLTSRQIVQVDAAGKRIAGSGQPSAETLLHLAVIRARGAGAVLHTHSVWSTILSGAFAAERRLVIQGYEMLKGLEGVRTHQHREFLPIIDNSQDISWLAGAVTRALQEWPGAHGLLLRGHGLYTWGKNQGQARRHLEILEFLLEVVGREHCAARGTPAG
jgi:methylthioribulose-1-phosphate dehydratase